MTKADGQRYFNKDGVPRRVPPGLNAQRQRALHHPAPLVT